ncbi:hypothetical protein Tco_1407842 [Tanacetum coccineum]
MTSEWAEVLDYAYGEVYFKFWCFAQQLQDSYFSGCLRSKLEGDALSCGGKLIWYFPAFAVQQRYERDVWSISTQLGSGEFGEYIKRFTRLASFVGATALGDAQRAS